MFIASVRLAAVVAGLLLVDACTPGTVTAVSRTPAATMGASPNWGGGTAASPPEPQAPSLSPRAMPDRPSTHTLERPPRIR
jgi:hypothetical protein